MHTVPGAVRRNSNTRSEERNEEAHCGNDEQDQMKDSHASHSNGVTSRDALVGIISKTIFDHRWDPFSTRDLAKAILDQIETPIRDDEANRWAVRHPATIEEIRADERAKHPDIPTVTRAAMDAALPMIYDMLRAKVQALPGAYIAAGVWENPPVNHDIDDWDGKPVVLRSAVLALLDGGSDE